MSVEVSQYEINVHLYKTLEEIRTRTPLYLKTPSITELRMFLNGFFTAWDTFDVKVVWDTLIPLPFGCFTNYVACRLGSDGSPGWWRIILNETAQDEEKGFQLFYMLLEEFKQLRISKCFAADLSDSNIAYHISDECLVKNLTGEHWDVREPVYKNPVKVWYAELIDDAEHKSYIGVVETDTESLISGLPWKLFRTEKDILADFKMYFGTIAWQKQNQKNIEIRSRDPILEA